MTGMNSLLAVIHSTSTCASGHYVMLLNNVNYCFRFPFNFAHVIQANNLVLAICVQKVA